ncbi:MAG: hypothetical protein JXA97_10765 [Anaerolineales bacterium]|nr:hypothetical protein [Anaerolineales bacterium]
MVYWSRSGDIIEILLFLLSPGFFALGRWALAAHVLLQPLPTLEALQADFAPARAAA